MLLVAVGGGLGAGARYGLGEWLKPRLRPRLAGEVPVEILAVNILGSLIIGLVTAWALRADASYWRTFLTTGFCGGFTTFSSATVGVLDTARAGHRALAFAYALANALGCLGAVALGFWLVA